MMEVYFKSCTKYIIFIINMRRKNMYCVNCGSKIQDGAKFCGNCGAGVNVVSVKYNQGTNSIVKKLMLLISSIAIYILSKSPIIIYKEYRSRYEWTLQKLDQMARYVDISNLSEKDIHFFIGIIQLGTIFTIVGAIVYFFHERFGNELCALGGLGCLLAMILGKGFNVKFVIFISLSLFVTISCMIDTIRNKKDKSQSGFMNKKTLAETYAGKSYDFLNNEKSKQDWICPECGKKNQAFLQTCSCGGQKK